MSNALRRTLPLLMCLAARGSAGAAEETGAWAASSRDASIHRCDRLTLASAWGASFPAGDLPRLTLTVGAPKDIESADMTRLNAPPFRGWQIDALGGAWLSPAVTRTFLRLVFRF